ncbi:MAG: hypothetical protein WKF73_18815 [Nocardioidaceae bacterium]
MHLTVLLQDPPEAVPHRANGHPVRDASLRRGGPLCGVDRTLRAVLAWLLAGALAVMILVGCGGEGPLR